MNIQCCLFVVFKLFLLSEIGHAAEDAKKARFFMDEDIMDNWNAASRFLGLDTSQGVASLVSSSLQTAFDKQDNSDPTQPSSSMFHGFFRLLGFDTSKLNAIAVNAVVFIAKMIGSSLIKNFTGTQTGRSMGEELTEGSPLTWILDDVKVQARSLLSRAQDPSLPDQLITALQSSPAHTDCIQLLVCRAAPFLQGMQRSLEVLLGQPSTDPMQWAALSPLQRMYHYLPSRQQLLDSAVQCKGRIPSCSQLFAAFED